MRVSVNMRVTKLRTDAQGPSWGPQAPSKQLRLGQLSTGVV